ncbi:uncharacterized protein [Heliangelus exortis]|uniref:uncharacterized protein isoform X1 n=1 Tax=Heliangelus exortis TaxID=472823 RepID=UPI003A958BE4
MKVLLMDLLEVLQQGSKDVQLKALRICRKVMGELTREEASSIAVELLDKLLPLFDNGLLSELREISISLFTELLKKVAGKCKRQMRNQVRRGLLPLWFHMSDDTQSVAEASSQALLDAAEFLKWQQLQHVVRTEQMWRIGECLVRTTRKPQAGGGKSLGCGLCNSASPTALLQPRAHSLELHPCSLSSRREPPGAPLQAPLPSLHPTGVSLGTPGAPSPPQSHRLLAGRGEWAGRKDWDTCP